MFITLGLSLGLWLKQETARKTRYDLAEFPKSLFREVLTKMCLDGIFLRALDL